MKPHNALYYALQFNFVTMEEWLPWLQTSWRDSGYQRFTLVLLIA